MKTKREHTDPLKNERGIAIVAVLLLSLIALGITASLLYMVTQGTRSSGFFKRYQSARNAGVGGVEITAALLQNLGQLTIPTLKDKDGLTDCVDFADRCDCGDPEVSGDNDPDTCLCAKICDPTSEWKTKCPYEANPLINPDALNPTTNYDIRCVLPGEGNKEYLVSSKIVDTIFGNTDMSGSAGLEGAGVVTAEGNLFAPVKTPFMYRVEVESSNKTSAIEKSRWAVLYAY